MAQSPKFILSQGLRYVTPTSRTVQVRVKGAHVGEQLVDVLTATFRHRDSSYWARAVQLGYVRHTPEKRGTTEGDNSVIQSLRDQITYTTHYHEPPVLDTLPVVVKREDVTFRDSDGMTVVAVNKPSSIPVHPCGKYHQLSVTELLFPTEGKLHPVNRLDRVTSGLVLLTPDSSAVNRLQNLMKDSCKEYVARVKGRVDVPSLLEKGVDGNVAYVEAEKGGGIRVSAPLSKSGKGVNSGQQMVCEDGQNAETSIYLLDTDGVTSVVRCILDKTGRQHQIRAHLAYLGHPIGNDGLYGGRWGLAPHHCKDSAAFSQIFADVDPSEFVPERPDSPAIGHATMKQGDNTGTKLPIKEYPIPIDLQHCEDCDRLDVTDWMADMAAPPMEIWLHAYRCYGPDIDIAIEHPAWASLRASDGSKAT